MPVPLQLLILVSPFVIAILVLRSAKSVDRLYKAGAGLALLATFLLVWVNLAVGIIGTEDNSANLLFAGVIGVGVMGAVLGRFTSTGMARAMGAAAIAQVLVAGIAIGAGWGSQAEVWPRDLLVMTAIFALLWLSARALFSRSREVQTPSTT